MRFRRVTQEEINQKSKKSKTDLKQEILEFISTGYKYALVEDNENKYNNANDLRRAFQHSLEKFDFPVVTFMKNGKTYLMRLDLVWEVEE